MRYPGVSLAILGLATSTVVTALPSTNYVQHEVRAGTSTRRSHWKRGDRIDGDAIIPVRIGLTQTNLHLGYDRLMEVAHPSSEKFGKHLTSDEVIDLFAPTDETVTVVRQWLIEEGIPESTIIPYENRGWLAIDIPVREAERLFRTEYHEHSRAGTTRLGCDEYSVPRHLSAHIDYISPGIKLSPPMTKRQLADETESPSHRRGGPKKLPPSHDKNHGSSPNWSSSGLPADLQGCSINMTVACLRALYDIPVASGQLSGNNLGLYESGDMYSQEDLNSYYATWVPDIPQGTGPVHNFIDGAEAPVPADSPYNTGESDIDMAITIPLIYPQNVTLYQTDDSVQADETNGWLNTFLDALDGSYCTYTAFGITGDSPGIDAVYPDPAPGGYKGKLMCGVYTPTRVISASYGEGELDVPKRYAERQCSEFMKLGLQGHTFLFSSGDYGVAQFPGDDSDSGCLSGYGQNQTIYNVDYASNCPYVTSVGATQLQADQTIKDPESAMQSAIGTGYEARFASGGGFSNYYTAPSYQKSAIDNYFDKHDPGHPYYIANEDATNIGEGGGIYNREGRGYPDVSANGAMFRMFTDQVDYYWFGTSLAAPLWASVITLINYEREIAGKGPVGFLNPVLYENTDVLNDITNGSNPNCGSSGYSAVEGWDPITGLGTPKYESLLKLYLDLP